jgi:type IV secretory pathway VirD2 relaxase
MAEMVRKQIYIKERQDRLLKRISKARGVSEAEIIRQAIERETVGERLPLLAPDQAAWDKILRFANSRRAHRPGARPYRWNRLDAYEERERRFTTHVVDKILLSLGKNI